ncbi:hypothetical protein CHS0354_041688 [Potamilus streckersoni]|uniref:Uncharacterized protein n=1 Tax=Potamilus streckersoni TaxID=2493646 RepID=A0AAE0VTH4_9BIVA|nr:hypothetical protein CHS0354_041688 [Potamilus streckersoni]
MKILNSVYIGQAVGMNPGYLKLRKIRAAQNIARTIATSQNRAFLNANTLMLNFSDPEFDIASENLVKKGKK